MSSSYCCHDHIVLLLDTAEYDSLPSWLEKSFTVLEGGTHTGGSSKNKLLIFSDGTYLELLTFINKSQPIVPAWTTKPPGLIDFALTTLRPLNAAENFRQLSIHLDKSSGGDGDLGVKYTAPKAGGRKRLDGEEVKWEITRPEFSGGVNTPGEEAFPVGRLDAPFFCHDVTPRVVRVPFDDEALTRHKCGVTGIKSVDVLVEPDKLTAYSTLYSSITGVEPQQITDGEKKGVWFGLTTPTSQGDGPIIRVRVPTSDEDTAWLKARGVGIREVGLSVGGRKGHGEEKLAGEGIGSTVSLVW